MTNTKEQKAKVSETGRTFYLVIMIFAGIFSLGIIPLSYWLMKRCIQNAIEDAV